MKDIFTKNEKFVVFCRFVHIYYRNPSQQTSFFMQC